MSCGKTLRDGISNDAILDMTAVENTEELLSSDGS